MSYISEARAGETPLQSSVDQKGGVYPTTSNDSRYEEHFSRQQSSIHQPQLLRSQSSLPLQSQHTPSTSPPTPSWTRFAIPTKEDSLSSGFPFHSRLYDLKVTNDQWHAFTQSLISAAKLTFKEDYMAWTTGIATGTLATPLLIVFAPWAGYHWGRKVHRKKQAQTVQEKLTGTGDLRAILHTWNTDTFAQLGFQAWLEVPRTAGDLVEDSNEVAMEAVKSKSKQKKMIKAAAKRFKIIIIPCEVVLPVSVTSAKSPLEVEGSTAFEQRGQGQRDGPFVAELPENIAYPPSYMASKENDFLPPAGTTARAADPAVVPPVNNYQRPEGFSNS